MPTPTFTKIATSTVSGSSTSSVTFSSIPSAYTDLLIYMSVDTSRSGGYYSLNNFVQINSQSTSTNYTGGYIYNDNQTSTNNTSSSPSVFPSSNASSANATFSNNWFYIPSYRSTTSLEMIFYANAGDNLNLNQGIILFGNARANTAEATNSITLKELSSNNFVSGTTFYLYGIKSS